MHEKLSRRGFLGASLGAAAIALAACTQSDKSEQAASTTEGDKEQRIVALNTGQLDSLLLLGITPVGVAAAKNADLIPQFLRDRFGDDMNLDSIADCGFRQDPDVEIIANLQPTLICANSRSDEALLQKLRAIAPVVTGEGDEAQAMLDAYEAAAAKVTDSQKDIPPTVSFLRTNKGEFQMYGAESMAGTVAADCGFARPQAQQFTDKAGKDLSAELIAEADADWLFYGVQKGSDSPADTSLWPTLKAVKNTQAIEIDYDSWYMNASLVSANVILDGLKTYVL